MQQFHNPEAGQPVGRKPQFPGQDAGQLGDLALVPGGIRVSRFTDRGQGLNRAFMNCRQPGQALL